MRYRSLLPAVLVAVLLVSTLGRVGTAGAAGGDTDAVAVTESGLVIGSRVDDLQRYNGIPYAEPPVGELRWKVPRSPRPWLLPRTTKTSGPACAQQGVETSREDCLYLDVTAPSGSGRRPVMVWVHGGGNTSGTGAEFDAARMARLGDVVVVTINYRLGVFGFFAFPGLAGSGTFGLQDQQAALRWVRHNAAAFGGDPHNVTVFGESAGAIDLCAQLTSPAARGLFDRVILQSGSCLTRVPSYAGRPGGPVHVNRQDLAEPVRKRELAGRAVAQKLDCVVPSALRCLRSRSTAAVLPYATNSGIAFAGGTVLPSDPAVALSNGKVHRVPVLSGSNRDEARLTTMYAELLAGVFTADSYRRTLRTAVGPQAATVEREYPAGKDPGLAFATMDTDRVFACPQLETSRRLGKAVPGVWGYEFADRGAPTYAPYFGKRQAGAAHASELAYLFDLRGPAPYHGTKPAGLTAVQRRLGDELIAEWTGFARTGRTTWPAYANPAHSPKDSRPKHSRPEDVSLADGRPAYVRSFAPGSIGRTDAWAVHRCDFWHRLDG